MTRRALRRLPTAPWLARTNQALPAATGQSVRGCSPTAKIRKVRIEHGAHMTDKTAIGPDRSGGPATETFRLTVGPDGSCRVDFLAGDEATVLASVALHPELADALARELANRRETWAQARDQSMKARH